MSLNEPFDVVAYIRDEVCCPRPHGCEVNGAEECPAERVRQVIDTQAAEIERLRASLAEAVGVLRRIADRAGDGRRTASLPVIAREARDFITKHGGEGE